MEDVRAIISQHTPKKNKAPSGAGRDSHLKLATTSEIPDLFFDEILVQNKLTRMEIMVLMLLYRQVWCRPNLFREYGIGPVQTYVDMAHGLGLSLDELQVSIRNLERLEFIETVRSGQYFVRKYFTKENDEVYGQHYNDFL
jgi:hypothetical protein